MNKGIKRNYESGLYMWFIIPLITIILFALTSFTSVENDSSDLLLSSSTFVVSKTFLHLLLTISGSLLVICLVIIILSSKLRKANRELILRNRQIETINNTLQRTNKELALQKETITREYTESDRFYKMLFQSADDGISFYNRRWELEYANSAFYSIIGTDKDSYHSLNIQDIIHPDDSSYLTRREKALEETGFFESELRLKHNNGHFLNLSTRSVAVKSESGEILGALTISRDITKLREIHENLVKANKEAEASNRLKSNFLANISHEIRTPLNSVIGFSNLLLSNNLTREVKEEYVEHINHNSEKLLQIIGDIIDLSRLESSQIEITYEEASVNEIVREVVDEARKIIRRNEKSIILNVRDQFEENSDLIFTDKIWLKRVLNHLMDNAIKFTLDGSVEFSYHRENDNLFFSIKDTGIGINKENLGRIFEEFRQEIDGHQRPFEGLGIGLTLAKEVIERMGGIMYVQSEKGIGSEFSFSIPFRPAGGTKTRLKAILKDQMSATHDWRETKCLLVDDNKDVLIYMNRILFDTGIKIFTARSGKEALKIIRETPDIGVVVLDMQMPEMNGIEVTREIRKVRKDLPIIAQTAFVFEDDKDIIIEAGCDACLIKPIRKEHLISVMSGFIK